jgi:hypothetical protein
VSLRGACNYKQTGLMQAYAAHHLVRGTPRRVGFASGCQAFGHRELLAVLMRFGFASTPIVSGQAISVPLQPSAPVIGSLNGAGVTAAASLAH